MRYLGGKYKTGKEISVLLKEIYLKNNCQHYYEPFCGSLNVIKHIDFTNNLYASDGCKDLIMLWTELKNNQFVFPSDVSKEVHKLLKNKEPSSLRAYYGFGHSFAGIWFATYNFNEGLNRSLIRKLDAIKKINFTHCDYNKIDVAPNSLIYCDPPYTNVCNNYGSEFSFNKNQFWEQCERWNEEGHTVVVSNTEAPETWVSIWNKPTRNNLNNLTTQKSIFNDHLYVKKINLFVLDKSND